MNSELATNSGTGAVVGVLLMVAVLLGSGGCCPSECQCYWDSESNLKSVSCDNSSLRSIPLFIPCDTEKLTLTHNNIQSISPDDFRGIQQLKIIDISNNLISQMDRKTFAGMDYLTSLYLTDNLLEYLPSGAFEGMRASAVWVILNRNPWTCNCVLQENADVLRAIETNLNYTGFACDAPGQYRNMSADSLAVDLCARDQWKRIAVILSVIGVTIVIVIVVVVVVCLLRRTKKENEQRSIPPVSGRKRGNYHNGSSSVVNNIASRGSDSIAPVSMQDQNQGSVC